jgi:hypothetical protein
MRTAAIVTTFTILGSFAYAAGQGAALRPQPAGAVTRSPVHEDGAVSQRYQGTTMAALAGSGGSCTVGEPLNWFTQVHPMPECADLVWGGVYVSASSVVTSRGVTVDVDGDGRDDHMVLAGDLVDPPSGATRLARSYALRYGAYLGVGKFPTVGAHALFRVTVESTGGDAVITLHPVMSGSVLHEALCAVAKPCDATDREVIFSPIDFKDLDGDGDLDLILEIEVRTPTYEYFTYRVWIENTVKANPPLAGDINRDGAIDGKDLAIVLSGWTG